MNVQGVPTRTIWLKKKDPRVVQIIDQRALPHRFVVEDLKTLGDCCRAIKDMHLRGAPLIGVAAAYGMYLAALDSPKGLAPAAWRAWMRKAGARLTETRPTAVNLRIGVERVLAEILKIGSPSHGIEAACAAARSLEAEEIENCRRIGEHGLTVIEKIHRGKKGRPVQILTHCNAGWLACVDWGTATAPMYAAFNKKIPVHVWVDETRPRNQGASLTAWELGQHGVPYTVIVDNAGGHLMQHGLVDLVIVGSDRTTASGDVANKIGTYLKALAAKDNGVPFYAALPSTTIDWDMDDGVREIPIEERESEEVTQIQGLDGGVIRKVLLTPKGARAANYGFDVTPRRLVTGIITERGIARASRAGLRKLFPKKQ
ncbi:MAG: S-methyl-5-thioribose-1-phosphate isomerase [Candidatus Omnitrophota bacterium]